MEPDIKQPPFKEEMFRNGVMTTAWNAWFRAVFKTIADLQARVTALEP